MSWECAFGELSSCVLSILFALAVTAYKPYLIFAVDPVYRLYLIFASSTRSNPSIYLPELLDRIYLYLFLSTDPRILSFRISSDLSSLFSSDLFRSNLSHLSKVPSLSSRSNLSTRSKPSPDRPLNVPFLTLSYLISSYLLLSYLNLSDIF